MREPFRRYLSENARIKIKYIPYNLFPITYTSALRFREASDAYALIILKLCFTHSPCQKNNPIADTFIFDHAFYHSCLWS